MYPPVFYSSTHLSPSPPTHVSSPSICLSIHPTTHLSLAALVKCPHSLYEEVKIKIPSTPSRSSQPSGRDSSVLQARTAWVPRWEQRPAIQTLKEEGRLPGGDAIKSWRISTLWGTCLPHWRFWQNSPSCLRGSGSLPAHIQVGRTYPTCLPFTPLPNPQPFFLSPCYVETYWNLFHLQILLQ